MSFNSISNLQLVGSYLDSDIVVKHTDPAMTGYLSKNSYLGIKSISRDSFMKMIVPGKPYIIVINEYVIERFVFEGAPGKFLLRSFNNEIAPEFEIFKSDISELFLITSWIQQPEVIPA